MTLPETLAPLFWDIDTRAFDPAAWPEYTLSRVLEYGDDEAVAWMRVSFSRDQIVHAVRSDRMLTPKSANYWALVYGVPREEVRALGPRDPLLGVPLPTAEDARAALICRIKR